MELSQRLLNLTTLEDPHQWIVFILFTHYVGIYHF